MLTATAPRSRKLAVGVKGIVECGHAALPVMPANLNGSNLSRSRSKNSGTAPPLDRGGAAITWLD